VSISEVTWVGMRVRVALEGAPRGATVDVRTKAASAAASKLDAVVMISDGTASTLVIDPDAMGEAAFVVVLAPGGTLLAQRSTTIGGDR
jgi:hypothetical protein